ncbi:MAG: saccharopine dehydrogenase NADP-binding domain-containing protein [Flavobacteriia bacterium]|jgi:short subunit dehydrogenase-like uncharacterized protein
MKISVVGAYGYTGKLICDELDSMHILYAIVGRNKQKLDELRDNLKVVSDSWCLDLQNENDCDFLISNSDLIINCAGPFTEESNILVKKMAQSGKVYLDISGELEFIKTSRENYHQIAIESKSLIIHGCAFESLITDLVLQNLKVENENVQAIRTFYLFEKTKASPGTRITMKLAKFRKNLKISAFQWTVSDLNKDILDVQISNQIDCYRAIVYPLPDIAFSHWLYQPEIVESYLLVKPEESLFILPRQEQPNLIIPTLSKLSKRKIAGPTKEERQSQTSSIIIQIVQKDEKEKILLVESNDMYQTTAKAILLSVIKILDMQKCHFGVLNPAVLFLKEENMILTKLGVKITDEQQVIIQQLKKFN